MKYQAPFGVTDPDASYINGNPAIGLRGSIPPALAFEQHQREIIAAIEASGQTSSDTDLTQLLKALRTQRMCYAISLNGTSGDDPDALVVQFDPPVSPSDRLIGTPMRVKVVQTNTGPCTLEVDGFTAPIIRATGADLEAGDIVAGQLVDLLWDGTHWQVSNFLGFSAGSTTNNTFLTNIPYVADTNVSPNVITANFSPAITALAAGDALMVKLAQSATGPTTINVNAIPSKQVRRPGGGAIQAGDIIAGQTLLLLYDGTKFQITGIIPSPTAGWPMPPGMLVLALANVAPTGTLKLAGGTYNRADYPALWDYANTSGRLVTDAVWTTPAQKAWANFSKGNGTSTFRVPDFRAEFLRMLDDSRGINPNRNIGSFQGDLVGSFSMSGSITVGDIIPAFSGRGVNNMLLRIYGNSDTNSEVPESVSVGSLTGSFTATGSGGAETRPRNVAVLPCVTHGA